jgi:uncharacterized membrane protein YfcA
LVQDWRETLTLLAGAVLGGYFGALVGKRVPSRVVRVVTLLVAGCITALFFVRTYGFGR